MLQGWDDQFPQGYPSCNTYNPDWRDFSNFQWEEEANTSYQYQGGQYYTEGTSSRGNDITQTLKNMAAQTTNAGMVSSPLPREDDTSQLLKHMAAQMTNTERTMKEQDENFVSITAILQGMQQEKSDTNKKLEALTLQNHDLTRQLNHLTNAVSEMQAERGMQAAIDDQGPQDQTPMPQTDTSKDEFDVECSDLGLNAVEQGIQDDLGAESEATKDFSLCDLKSRPNAAEVATSTQPCTREPFCPSRSRPEDLEVATSPQSCPKDGFCQVWSRPGELKARPETLDAPNELKTSNASPPHLSNALVCEPTLPNPSTVVCDGSSLHDPLWYKPHTYTLGPLPIASKAPPLRTFNEGESFSNNNCMIFIKDGTFSHKYLKLF